jgi:hypothetical protein
MAFTYQQLSDIAGLNSDGVTGFETQVAMRKPGINAVWPEHFVGKRIDDFRHGAELARAWMNMRRGVGQARRSMRQSERKEIGIMNVYSPSSASDRKAEQIETLKQVVESYRRIAERHHVAAEVESDERSAV